MKRIIFAMIIAFALVSCSEDKDETPVPGGAGSQILLTQLVINYPNNQTYTKQYLYEDGNKLSEIIDSNGNREYYTYSGNFISKIEYRNNNPEYLDERLFTYDNTGRLIEEIFLYHFNSVGTRTVFNYMGDGNINYETFSGDLISQLEPSLHGTYALGSKGEILENNEHSDVNSTNRILTYSYDAKNSPYLNIRDDSKDFKFVLMGGINNTKSFKFVQSGFEVYSYSSQFEYNTNGFPDSERKADSSGTSLIYFTYN
jgi:hypothetical protein